LIQYKLSLVGVINLLINHEFGLVYKLILLYTMTARWETHNY